MGGGPGVPRRRVLGAAAQARGAGAQGQLEAAGLPRDDVRRGLVDLARGRARVRPHPAGRVVVGRDAEEQLGGDPGPARHCVGPVSVDGVGALGLLRQARAAHLGARPVGRPRPRRRRHVEGGGSRRLLPAPGPADAPSRCVVGVALGVLRGAVASRLPSSVPAVSAPGVASGIVLDVPRYSQMVHRGEFSQYGGGGEAWCSPTSTAMVLGYYGRLPSPALLLVGRLAARPLGGRGRSSDLRRRLRRHRQLAVQHGVRRLPRALRLRHPAPIAVGGRVADRGRHPRDRLGVLLARAGCTAHPSRPRRATSW